MFREALKGKPGFPDGFFGRDRDRENENLLKVYAEHPTISRYLGPREKGYPGQENSHFRILMAEIVADKVVQRILQAKIDANPRLFGDPDKFFFIYSEEMTSFLPIAHKIMLPDRDVPRPVQKDMRTRGNLSGDQYTIRMEKNFRSM